MHQNNVLIILKKVSFCTNFIVNKDIEMKKKNVCIQQIKIKISQLAFISAHKTNLKDFTRTRILTFAVVFMLILRKSLKSLQLSLNELFIQGHLSCITSSSAYTQARKKFRHTAFMELNDDVIKTYYSDDKIKRWKGYRCLGVDGSKIVLPNFADVEKEYGSIKIKTQYATSKYCGGLFVCCYDVLNKIAVSSILSSGSSYEVDLATQILSNTAENDLLIYDRGFASYEFLATHIKQNKDYVIRCSSRSFAAARSLFKGEGYWNKVVSLVPPADQRKNIQEKNLPSEIKVRFVSVILPTGEIEVLITSLFDSKITRNEFKHLYSLRWGVESFYFLLKSRLSLENFTGQTAESIKQDFWSTIFISNLATVLTEEAEENLNSELKETQYKKKVNKAVSFNVIKNMAFEIFNNKKDETKAVEKMELLFKTGSVIQRPERLPSRIKQSIRRSYNFLRRVKKIVF
jgi:DDE family transposase